MYMYLGNQWKFTCCNTSTQLTRKVERRGNYFCIKVISVLLSLFSVDAGSLAEQAGFKVGDQIMEVNGKNFENLKHKEAVDFIKSQKHIMVTLKVTLFIDSLIPTCSWYSAANSCNFFMLLWNWKPLKKYWNSVF